MLDAVVIGLGQAGSRFDEEPRRAVWSHAGGYLACGDLYRLVGGADIDAGNRKRFADRCPDATVADDCVALVRDLRPDAVSVCTPALGRGDLVERLVAAHRPKVLVCEKPLELDSERRRRMVAVCAEAEVTLIVNYNRRYAETFRRARAAIVDGRIGRLTAITVSAPNRLWSVGSHAVDLLLYLAGDPPERMQSLALPALEEGDEPARDVLCRFPSGAAGRVLTTGYRDMLVFEADVIGTKGRVRIGQLGTVATFASFRASNEFDGYRVLGEEKPIHVAADDESTFVALVREAAALAAHGGRPSSSGEDALASEEILDALARDHAKEAA